MKLKLDSERIVAKSSKTLRNSPTRIGTQRNKISSMSSQGSNKNLIKTPREGQFAWNEMNKTARDSFVMTPVKTNKHGFIAASFDKLSPRQLMNRSAEGIVLNTRKEEWKEGAEVLRLKSDIEVLHYTIDNVRQELKVWLTIIIMNRAVRPSYRNKMQESSKYRRI